MSDEINVFTVGHPGGCDSDQQLKDLKNLQARAKAARLTDVVIVSLNEQLHLQITTPRDSLPGTFISERQIWAALIIDRSAQKR